jgi:hypothetical protein
MLLFCLKIKKTSPKRDYLLDYIEIHTNVSSFYKTIVLGWKILYNDVERRVFVGKTNPASN